MTYGAGGSTRERTHDLVVKIKTETELTAVSHLTCVCHLKNKSARSSIAMPKAALRTFSPLGGDPPKAMADHNRAGDAFRYASDLVKFIRVRDQECRTRAASASASPAFPKGIPAHPID